jgi:hypothetical protein
MKVAATGEYAAGRSRPDNAVFEPLVFHQIVKYGENIDPITANVQVVDATGTIDFGKTRPACSQVVMRKHVDGYLGIRVIAGQ